MVTPKRVVEITPLVVAQIELRERALRERRSALHQDAKRDRLTTSQKLGRA